MYLIVSSIIVYIAIGYSDLLYRTIPDFLSIAIVAFAVFHWAISPQIGAVLWTIGTAAVVFATGAFLFARGWLGGGDVKLISATALLLGSEGTLPFLIWMAVTGGVLAALVLACAFVNRRWVRPGISSGPLVETYGRVGPPVSVPYGVAIALSAILVLFPQLYQQ